MARHGAVRYGHPHGKRGACYAHEYTNDRREEENDNDEGSGSVPMKYNFFIVHILSWPLLPTTESSRSIPMQRD